MYHTFFPKKFNHRKTHPIVSLCNDFAGVLLKGFFGLDKLLTDLAKLGVRGATLDELVVKLSPVEFDVLDTKSFCA